MDKFIILTSFFLSLWIGFRNIEYYYNPKLRREFLISNYITNRGLVMINTSSLIKNWSVEEKESFLLDILNKIHSTDWRVRQAILMLLIHYSRSDLNLWDDLLTTRWTSLDEKFRIYKFGAESQSLRVSMTSHKYMFGRGYADWVYESMSIYFVRKDLSPDYIFDRSLTEHELSDFRRFCNFYEKHKGEQCD
jgi:hypothetical protein